jgi:mRNA-degrading endonuclease YafQ of YafQ-DinJ toxin-antitoxin module
MRIGYSERFLKQQEKAPECIRALFKGNLKIFLQDKFAPLLYNHGLKGKFQSCRSINVGGDWRAIFEELPNGDICFLLFGTHSQLYK